MTTLGPISAVTIAAAELQHQIDSYKLYLGYELVEHGKVSNQLANLWGRPQLAGRRYALMQPGGAGQSFMRFVESRPVAGYTPFRHLGWNAAEIVVQDTDGLAARLADSPFRIIGPPADLSFTDKIRATQVLGPAKEALYLTQVKGVVPGFDLPVAKTPVDRVFIVILGGHSIASLNEFYTRHFGVPKGEPMPVVISVLSAAFGMPADARHELAALPLAAQTYIEADAMPAGVAERVGESGDLPPAIAMVSFAIDALPMTTGLTWLAEPQAIAQAPYYGRQAAVCVGPAGELIEVIES